MVLGLTEVYDPIEHDNKDLACGRLLRLRLIHNL